MSVKNFLLLLSRPTAPGSTGNLPCEYIYKYCFTSLSEQSWQYSEARSQDYTLLLFRMTSRVLYGAQCHRQHCTLQAFEQFGALYMHNNDDKYPARNLPCECTKNLLVPALKHSKLITRACEPLPGSDTPIGGLFQYSLRSGCV